MKIALYKSGAQLMDVQQGDEPSCYFLAAVAAATLHSPDQMETLVRPTSDGRVQVQVGNKQVVMQWNSLINSSGAKAHDHEFWVKALEEAWLQVAPKDATVADAMAAITGQSVVTHPVTDEAWNTLTREQGVPVVANTPQADLWDLVVFGFERFFAVLAEFFTGNRTYVLAPAHSLAVLGVREPSQGQREVELFDPASRERFFISFEQFKNDFATYTLPR